MGYFLQALKLESILNRINRRQISQCSEFIFLASPRSWKNKFRK